MQVRLDNIEAAYMSDSLSQLDKRRTILFATEVGVGQRYILETRLLEALEAKGFRIVVCVLDPDEVRAQYQARYPRVVFASLPGARLPNGVFRRRAKSTMANILYNTRMAGMSSRMNLATVNHIEQNTYARLREGPLRWSIPLVWAARTVLRRSRRARAAFERLLPLVRNYEAAEAVRKFNPSLVVTTSPGWFPREESVLRTARAAGIPTAAMVVGWEHTSSKGLPTIRPDRVFVWSKAQREELVDGSDFDAESIEIAGPAHFDMYLDPRTVPPADALMRGYGLDPSRKLIVFACSFVGMSSNYEIVEAIAHLVADDALAEPSQLIIRLHPTHLKRAVAQYVQTGRERTAYETLAQTLPHVHLSYPLLTSKTLPNAVGSEDVAELRALLTHSDVLVTLFSTMVVEAALHGLPTVTTAIDPSPAWRWRQTLEISRALTWPTHERILKSGSTITVTRLSELRDAIDRYLKDPALHREARRNFVEQECTYLDGRSAQRLAESLSLMAGGPAGGGVDVRSLELSPTAGSP